MPTIRQVWLLIQHGNYTFSIDLKDGYLHIPIVKHHHHFLCFVWQHKRYQWKNLLSGLAMALRVSTSLNPSHFFANAKVIMLLYIMMIFWS